MFLLLNKLTFSLYFYVLPKEGLREGDRKALPVFLSYPFEPKGVGDVARGARESHL